MTSFLNKQFKKYALKYPNFEEDLLKEITLQKTSLKMIKLRLQKKFTVEEFSSYLKLPRPLISRLESGRHNPTILTLMEVARRSGYEVELKFKRYKI